MGKFLEYKPSANRLKNWFLTNKNKKKTHQQQNQVMELQILSKPKTRFRSFL